MSNPQPLHHQSGFTTWPAALPESITRPGPEGWACFPQATVTFFVPPQPTMALQGEATPLVAQEPTSDMPAEVTLSPEEIKVWFGDWPTILQGRSFRPVQYEVQEVDAPDAETMRGSLSLAPCNQVLEGRYARHASFFVPPQPTMALQGEVTPLVAQEPTCDMPAEVVLNPEEIKLWFGDWPTTLRGRSFRPVQYEVQEVDAPDAETMRGSLSLAPCNQVLEGRYARHASSGEVVEEGMWFIRLGPGTTRVMPIPAALCRGEWGAGIASRRRRRLRRIS